MKKNATRMLVEGAIFVALAQVLGYLKLFRMPNGGSFTLLMVPIVIYAIRWGWKQGLLAGLALGLLQFAFDPSPIAFWQSILFDQVLASTVLGFAGLFHKKKHGAVLGMLTAGILRFVSFYLSGVTIWAISAPEEIFGMTVINPWFYSLVYNGSYMLPSIVICVIVIAILDKPLGKYLRGEDIK